MNETEKTVQMWRIFTNESLTSIFRDPLRWLMNSVQNWHTAKLSFLSGVRIIIYLSKLQYWLKNDFRAKVAPKTREIMTFSYQYCFWVKLVPNEQKVLFKS